MDDTKIRWAGSTWNPMTGCTRISPGCDHCYAETLANKFRGKAFPNGFDPTYKPERLNAPAKWTPRRVFVNSMSDVHHESFTYEQVVSVYDTMLRLDHHDYLVLTKRPQRMATFAERYLRERCFDAFPTHIWLGASVESDKWCFRANHLRRIPVPIRFLSCEPLIGPLPSLDLTGISWVIVGGESGRGFRPMDHEWARQLRDRCAEAGVAFYFKQSAAPRTEMGVELDGQRWEQYPLPHPASSLERAVGVYVDTPQPEQVATL
jgi:protein gp37